MPLRLLWVTSGNDPLLEQGKRALDPLGDVVVETAASPSEALEVIGNTSIDVVVADYPGTHWPQTDWPAEGWLEEVQRINSAVPVLFRHRQPSLDDAIRLTRLGAYYVLGPEADGAELARRVEEAVEYRRTRELALMAGVIEGEPWRKFLVGESRPMRNIAEIIRLVGSRRSTILITGETGTGKEMAARAIHMASGRSHLPMVAVNCSALPATLLEAELFGHVRGAFTGAINHRVGRFEQAHRSTLFLDEIGDMPLDLQSKLLRVLQEREIERLGSSESIRIDVRVVAASNADLSQQIQEGKFREDLFYRLNVVPVRMPPLREHLNDVPLLVHHFIDKICRQEGLPPKQITREALSRLSGHDWPGNVRQLENAVEMAIALSGDTTHLYPSDFPLPAPSHAKMTPPGVSPVIRVPEDGLDFERTVNRIERSILDQALQKTGGNKKMAADMLHLKRTTLSAKLKSLEAVAV
ncbi:MAG: sigma-54 dependent transcriptional regulator [Bryobacteraceae bacterium]